MISYLKRKKNYRIIKTLLEIHSTVHEKSTFPLLEESKGTQQYKRMLFHFIASQKLKDSC